MPDGTLRRAARRLPGYRGLQVLLDLARGSERRQSAMLRLRAPRGLFQPFGVTSEDRYPLIFGLLRDRLGAEAPVRLLSFGCATGEEVASLRRYFPNATIKGVDISAARIATCQIRFADDAAVAFAVAGSADDEPAAAYDAVLAMAVLRDGRLDDAAPVARDGMVARFESEAIALARAVRPGGFLVIRHASFRFEDTAVAADFDPVLALPCRSTLYGRDGKRLPDQSHELVVFCKTRPLPTGEAPR